MGHTTAEFSPFYQPHFMELSIHRSECFAQVGHISREAFHVLVPVVGHGKSLLVR